MSSRLVTNQDLRSNDIVLGWLQKALGGMRLSKKKFNVMATELVTNQDENTRKDFDAYEFDSKRSTSLIAYCKQLALSQQEQVEFDDWFSENRFFYEWLLDHKFEGTTRAIGEFQELLRQQGNEAEFESIMQYAHPVSWYPNWTLETSLD